MKVNFKLLATFALAIGINYSAFCQTWDRIGNTILATDYLGSNNNFALNFRTNGVQRMTILGGNATTGGFVGLGNNATFTPIDRLHLHHTTASIVSSRFTNSITGVTAEDGFQLGITNTGAAEIRQFEKGHAM